MVHKFQDNTVVSETSVISLSIHWFQIFQVCFKMQITESLIQKQLNLRNVDNAKIEKMIL